MGTVHAFINILDSLTAPSLVYNTAMYTVYGLCSQYGRCMVHTLANAAGMRFIWTHINTFKKCLSSELESEAVKFKVSQL